MKNLIILMSLVIGTNCFASQTDDKENVENGAVRPVPANVFADLPPSFDFLNPEHKYRLQLAHAKLLKACKTGSKLKFVQGTLDYCPYLVGKFNKNEKSLLYLVIKNAKRGCGIDVVFNNLDDRLQMQNSILRSVKKIGGKIGDLANLNSLLSIACFYGHRDMAAMLLDEGADVNHVDVQGFHTMHNATLNYGHSTEMIKLLLEKGARLNPVSRHQKTPMNLIVARNDAHYDREDTLAFLQKLGAKYASQLMDEANAE